MSQEDLIAVFLTGGKTYATLKRVYHSGQRILVTREEWETIRGDRTINGEQPMFTLEADMPADPEPSPNAGDMSGDDLRRAGLVGDGTIDTGLSQQPPEDDEIDPDDPNSGHNGLDDDEDDGEGGGEGEEGQQEATGDPQQPRPRITLRKGGKKPSAVV